MQTIEFQQEKTVHLDIIATACGFFSVRLMIYFKEFVIDKIFKHNKGKDVDAVSFPEGVELFPENEDEEKENKYDLKLKKMLEAEEAEKAKENKGDDNDAMANWFLVVINTINQIHNHHYNCTISTYCYIKNYDA